MPKTMIMAVLGILLCTCGGTPVQKQGGGWKCSGCGIPLG